MPAENTAEIGMDEFNKVKMVVGKVLEVKDHPRADKLCLLQVDTGDRVRQLVAGIKPYVSAAELKDKEVVVVVNLHPLVLRGERSEGMLLAAHGAGGLAILVPDRPIGAGSAVC